MRTLTNLFRRFPLIRVEDRLAGIPPVRGFDPAPARCPACGDLGEVFWRTVDGLVCRDCWKVAV